MNTPAATVRWSRRVAEAGVAAALTLVALTVHLRLWRARWSEPFVRGGDADYYLMLARNLMHHGSYLHNASLGWPFGQQLADSPEGLDNLHLLVIRLFGFVTGSPGGAVNLFYVWTFAAAAFTSHLVLRRLGRSNIASCVGAFVYAFAPYHFIRGEVHLFLSGYEMLPIGVLLALRLLDEPLPLLHATGIARVRWRSTGTWLVLGAVALLASTGPYYFAFSMLCIALAATVSAVSRRSWRPAVSGASMIGVGLVVVLVNLSPALLFRVRHGGNPAVVARSPFETELYGLKIFQLFVPRQLHRIDVVSRLSTKSQGPAGLMSEPGQQLGLLGALVLAGMLVAFVFHAFGVQGRRRWLDDADAVLMRRVTAFTVLAMLVGAIGGLSFFLSMVVRDIRAYNRISILIAFFTVIGLATVFDRLVTAGVFGRVLGRVLGRVVRRVVRRDIGAGVVAAALVLVAFVDQGGQDVPSYSAIHAQYSSDAAFFSTVRQRLGAGASVWNLPFLPFFEVPPRLGVGPYDEARGYILEPSLNWSFGFMRGRHPDYPAVLETQPTTQWMRSISAIGFTGIVLDRSGYTDADRARLESEIASLAGPASASRDGRYSLFDLRAYAASVRAELGPNGVAALASQTLALQAADPSGPAG